MKQIQAKPTVYRGVTYRSRLEARWAIYFDNGGMFPLVNNSPQEDTLTHWFPVIDWQYEPITIMLDKRATPALHKLKGQKYTPDFFIRLGDSDESRGFLVEVKPLIPQGDYLRLLHTIAVDVASPYIPQPKGQHKGSPLYVESGGCNYYIDELFLAWGQWFDEEVPNVASLFLSNTPQRIRYYSHNLRDTERFRQCLSSQLDMLDGNASTLATTLAHRFDI